MAGVNFADIYRHLGHYRALGQVPYINCYEGAGAIVALALSPQKQQIAL
nr:hypothetical protein [Komagataeibacter medellinensis]